MFIDVCDRWPTLTSDLENKMYMRYFRVAKQTFDAIAGLIMDAVPARKGVAVTLYWLGRGSYSDDVALIFGIGKTTVHQILHETVAVMNEQLVPHAIKWPGEAETFQNIVDFEALCGMPQSGGAIDGCFIPMEVPAGPYADKCWCYKNIHASILLAICDAHGKILYINVGQPGSWEMQQPSAGPHDTLELSASAASLGVHSTVEEYTMSGWIWSQLGGAYWHMVISGPAGFGKTWFLNEQVIPGLYER
ncbi:hypothetical protein WJX82_008867 [Trebouxia sp. C0006]